MDIKIAMIIQKIASNYKPHIDLYIQVIEFYKIKITGCILICDFGNNDKCLNCDMKAEKESLCGSCNEGYKLIEGKCKKIENLIIGIYNIQNSPQYLKIHFIIL